MKKIVISVFIIISFVLYGIFHGETETATVSSPTISSGNSSTSTVKSSSTTFKDGTYTGSAADAFYGNIQVQATIAGGKITNITFLQYPNDRGRSIEINQLAVPQLTQEAIQAQSANVDIVSGATDSSQAFIQSLTDALNQAKA